MATTFVLLFLIEGCKGSDADNPGLVEAQPGESISDYKNRYPNGYGPNGSFWDSRNFDSPGDYNSDKRTDWSAKSFNELWKVLGNVGAPSKHREEACSAIWSDDKRVVNMVEKERQLALLATNGSPKLTECVIEILVRIHDPKKPKNSIDFPKVTLEASKVLMELFSTHQEASEIILKRIGDFPSVYLTGREKEMVRMITDDKKGGFKKRALTMLRGWLSFSSEMVSELFGALEKLELGSGSYKDMLSALSHFDRYAFSFLDLSGWIRRFDSRFAVGDFAGKRDLIWALDRGEWYKMLAFFCEESCNWDLNCAKTKADEIARVVQSNPLASSFDKTMVPYTVAIVKTYLVEQNNWVQKGRNSVNISQLPSIERTKNLFKRLSETDGAKAGERRAAAKNLKKDRYLVPLAYLELTAGGYVREIGQFQSGEQDGQAKALLGELLQKLQSMVRSGLKNIEDKILRRAFGSSTPPTTKPTAGRLPKTNRALAL
ncbi:MAG: hypothetical protein AAF320_01150 [Myxococcota bacterium]